MITELNKNNFDKETQNGLKLIDFYTTWCSFCKKQDEVIKELSKNGIWVGKLDCDKYLDIAKKYKVSGFPSFILFKNGKIITQFAGYHSKEQLMNKLASVL